MKRRKRFLPVILLMISLARIDCSASEICNLEWRGPEDAEKEIALLVLQRDALTGSAAALLRTVLEETLLKKLAQFHQAFGHELSRESLQHWVAIGRQEGNAAVQARIASERASGAREKQALSPVIMKAELRLSGDRTISRLDDQSITMLIGADQRIAGEGAQWTEDDRFLLVRQLGYAGRIYDLERGKWLAFKPRTGYLSRTGHFYVEHPSPGKARVRNLVTGTTIAEIEGDPTAHLFTKDFLITRAETERAGAIEMEYTLHHFVSGKSVLLGTNIGVSDDFRYVAHQSGDRIRVLEASTLERVADLKAAPAEQPDLKFFGSPFFAYLDDQGEHRFFRYSDQALFKHPSDFTPETLVLGGRKITYHHQNANGDELQIYDISADKRDYYEPGHRGDYKISPQGTHAISFNREDAWSYLLDLETFGEKELPAGIDQFSADGRWLLGKIGEPESPRLLLYRLSDGHTVELKGAARVEFIPGTDWLMLPSSPGQPALLTHPDAGVAAGFVIGEQEIRASRTGRYVLTLSDGQVQVKELKK